jgi:hypothetical protein
MSAQDYYHSGALPPASAPVPTQPIPVPQQNIQQGPPPPPAPPLQATPPYPLYDGPPPPYSAGFDQRPHSQPPPAQRVDATKPQHQQQQPQPQYRPTHLSAQYRPQPQPHPYNYEYPPEKQQQPYPAHDEYRRDPYAQPPGPKSKHDRHASSNSQYPPSLSGGQYSSIYRGRKDDDKRYYDEDYERQDRSRSRSSSRSRGRDRDVRRKHVERKKSSGVNTFLGAGGGALIGDMIFPGLGTIGGALLGGVGGHEYGKGKSRGKNHHERSPVSSGRRTRRYSNEDDTEYRRRKY